MKKHTHHKAYGDSTGKEPLIDLQIIRQWFSSFGNQGHSSEAVLNVVFTVGVSIPKLEKSSDKNDLKVFLFVIYQCVSLLHRINKRVEKQLENKTKQKRVRCSAFPMNSECDTFIRSSLYNWFQVDVSDRQVGDEMVFTDLHENVIRERMVRLSSSSRNPVSLPDSVPNARDQRRPDTSELSDLL